MTAMTVGFGNIGRDSLADTRTRRALDALSDPNRLVTNLGVYIDQTGKIALRLAANSGLSQSSSGLTATANRSVSSVTTTTAAGSTSRTHYIYLANGTFTITLPTAVANDCLYTIKNVGSGTITIATTSAQTIDGSSSATLPVAYTSLDIISDNANWNII